MVNKENGLGDPVQQGEAGPIIDRKTQQQRREETRAKLIDAAIHLIQSDGCANLTTTRVAKAAGLTRGAIQYHFSSPKDLLQEVIVTIVQKLNVLVAQTDLSHLGKSERLDRLIDHYWAGYKSDIYVVFLEIAVQGHRDTALKKSIEEGIARLDEERDEYWLGFFSDYSESRDEILDWRTVLLVLLRGLAVKKMFSGPHENIDDHYARLKEMFQSYVSGGPRPF
ncbi:TetR/AcrR family transcriptional regulator [Sneathiella sp.]|uniref:TetR/AcrR family transcriptional regulator n=1 Tax=Sneathiella sp. TaxID=1964365 RepID=UPI0039E5A998